jgi:signal transduction histidine kinase
MKTLRVRKWMAIGMLSIVIFPWLSYFAVHALEQRLHYQSAQRQSQQYATALNTAMRDIADSPQSWHNARWQNTIRSELGQLGVDAVIQSPDGTEILGTTHVRHWMQPANKAVVVEGGRQMGTVSLFTPMQHDALASVAAIAAVVFAIFFVGLQMRRYVVRPLEAMSKAARQIAGGDLDFELPSTRVTEIDEVRTAFHAMGQGIRESIERQARLEEERRFFIGAIAHDLRTPLFALRGYLDGLEQGIANSPEKISKYITVCKEKSDQLDRLVSDLFAYTKLEYMEQTLRVETVDLAQLLECSADSLRPRAQEKGVSLTLRGDQTRCVIEADKHLLERAVDNLLDNALRHTPPGGEISIRWKVDPDRVTFSVADTGTGIAPDDLAHVFQPLYRGESSRNRETGGAGLGLTIARRILRAHGGDLVAANQVTGGAILTGWISRHE